MDIKLLGGRPVSRILMVELNEIVNGILIVLSYFQNSEHKGTERVYCELKLVYPMLIELLSKVSDKDIQAKLSAICLRLMS